jgi:hypothetical protein
MRLLLAHEPQVHYPAHDRRDGADLASFRLTAHQLQALLARGGGIQADCSELVTELCRWAGLADPNGLAYARAGYTGTMLDHLPPCDPLAADVGDLVVLGPGTGDHVCMVLEHGDDPLLFSHGQEAGPLAVSLSREAAAHRPPVRFLSVASL